MRHNHRHIKNKTLTSPLYFFQNSIMSMVITTTTTADYRLVLPLYIDIIKILYMSMPLYACSMASLPVLVYWCGGVTAPHTGLAYVLQRFGSFPVNPSGRRYFWKRCRVYGDFYKTTAYWVRLRTRVDGPWVFFYDEFISKLFLIDIMCDSSNEFCGKLRRKHEDIYPLAHCLFCDCARLRSGYKNWVITSMFYNITIKHN